MISALIFAAIVTSPVQPGAHVKPTVQPDFVQQQPASKSFSLEERTQVMKNLIKHMNDIYVMPDIAKKIESALNNWMKTKEFNEMNDGITFARKVNEIIKANVTDAHLRFIYSRNVLPVRSNPTRPSSEEVKRQQMMVEKQNSFFKKVERLDGNIGYFKFDMFRSQKDVRRPMAAVMNFLANTDGMIIDLRQNGGGHPEGVQLVCSYFFGEEPVHLNSIYFREDDTTHEFWTLKELDAPRYLNKPLYILVSDRTGSGAEECAYNFQQLKRGTIVGIPTWGGANPGGVVRLNDHFQCFIPNGRAINPYTKTNWEGTGVIPDVNSEPDQALNTAHKMIVKDLIEKEKDEFFKAGLHELLKKLEGE